MKREWLFLISLAVVFLLTMNQRVLAQPQPNQYYGEDAGEISGYVLGVSGQPVDWAAIYAVNGQNKYQAFSGMSGFYAMEVPAAIYNLTIKVPGYEALVTNATVTNGSTTKMNFSVNSINVAVSSGSSSVINFYLEQTQTPVPEFQPGLSLTLIMVTFAAILLFRRSAQHKPR